MKKILLSVATATLLTINFSGCASNRLAIGSSEVKQVFKEGNVISTKKVLVTKSKTAVLSGAVVGAAGGAVVDQSVKGGLVGAVVGAGIGAVVGVFQEIEAYETVIKTDDKNVTAYLETKLPKNTTVEYVARENGEITNVNVIEKAKPKVVTKTKTIYKTKVIEKPVIVEKEKVVYKTKEVPVPVPVEIIKKDDKKSSNVAKNDSKGVSYQELVELKKEQEKAAQKEEKKNFW